MSQNIDNVSGGTQRQVRRAGDEPPDIPSESTLEDLLPRLLEGVDEVESGYHVRATLPSEGPERAGKQLVDALERKVTVLGSTLDAGIDPADPQVDVLIQCEYTASQVASALGGVTPVQGAVVVEATDLCQRIIDVPQEAEEADAADANDVFSQLQQQVSELDYDEVLDELEGVSFPGGPDPDEEVDLETEANVDLSSGRNDDGDVELEDVALDDDALESDPEPTGSDDGGLLGENIDAKELFGESDGATDDRDVTSGIVGGADENRIEEAIRSVELSEELPDSNTDDDEDIGDTGVAEPGAETAEPDSRAAVDGGATSMPAPDTEVPEPDTGGESAEATPLSPPAGEMDELVDGLITALESGAIDPDRRQRLREALGVESTHSLDVRLEYVQKRVDNLAAYTDSWEAFLSEEGTGNKFIQDVSDELDALSARVEALEKR